MIALRAIIAAAAAILLLPAGASLTTAGVLVTVGEVTPTSAVVWTRGVREGDVTVEYGPVGRERSRARIAVRATDDFTGKLTLDQLSPATRYGYRLTASGDTVDGEFVTAPAADAGTAVTFAWSGDLGGQGTCRQADTATLDQLPDGGCRQRFTGQRRKRQPRAFDMHRLIFAVSLRTPRLRGDRPGSR